MKPIEAVRKHITNYVDRKQGSKARLAQLAGIDPAFISRIETNDNPGLEYLEKIAVALNIALTDLLTDPDRLTDPERPHDLRECNRRVQEALKPLLHSS